jgi:hypothetical protein
MFRNVLIREIFRPAPMPDRLKVMTKTKRDTLVLQVGGLAWG